MWIVLLASGLSTEARAVDLESLVEAWTRSVDGQGGSDGIDRALGAALDASGDLVAVGYLDGAPGHGSDGYALSWDPTGAIRWELTQDAGEIGPDRSSSSDRLSAVSIDPLSGDLAFCGARGPELPGQPPTRYLVEAWDDNGGALPIHGWTVAYQDGPNSTDQACFGTVRVDGLVYATGWGLHDGSDAGRWFSWKFDETNAQALTAVPYQSSGFLAVPDQAYDIVPNTLTGEFAVVGTRGFSGLDGSLLNDTDWHVRYYDPSGGLLWEHTLAGPRQLDDRALGAAIDVSTGDLYVVGWVNQGDDNGPGADLDWVVLGYDRDGDGLGGGLVRWTHTWGSALGASEGATAVILDDLSDLLVGGWRVDPGSGVDQWRVARLSATDGGEIGEWVGPAHAGDSRISAIDFRSSRIGIVGSTDDGSGPDFAGAILEGDRDEDGVADSVDACPDDPAKAADRGVCGCNVPDDDADRDGVESCIDDCPQDPAKTELTEESCPCGEPDVDSDGDGALDCLDGCADDPGKVAPLECGCGTPDDDTDQDGVVACHDGCSDTPPGAAVDDFGCPLEPEDPPTGDTGGSEPAPKDPGGCGCTTGPGRLGGATLLLLAAAAARRRRRL